MQEIEQRINAIEKQNKEDKDGMFVAIGGIRDNVKSIETLHDDFLVSRLRAQVRTT